MSRKRREQIDGTTDIMDSTTSSSCGLVSLVEEEDVSQLPARHKYPTFTLPPSVPKMSCYRRLLRDLAEVQREDLPTVSACPLENNLLEWHVNLTDPDGCFAGVYIHCAMKFPLTYPSTPPNIEILTPIPHPNVLGNFVCLSMLTTYGSGRPNPFDGWTSAYSVMSILYQLQSFFFAECAGQERKEYREDRNSREDEFAIENARAFSCVTCGHSHKNPFPNALLSIRGGGLASSVSTVQSETEEMSNEDEEEIGNVEKCFDKWAELPQDCCLVVLQFLDVVSLYCASWTSHAFQSVFDKFSLGSRSSIRCFFTKLSYSESLLGFGFQKIGPGLMTSQMDYLCQDAWNAGVREDSWGSHLDVFIPLILNGQHGDRAFVTLMKSLRSVANKKSVVFVVARLMHDLVSTLAKTVCGITKSGDCYCRWNCTCMVNAEGMAQIHKTLLGYSSLHHILLYLVERSESCRRTVRRVVQDLVNGRVRQKQVPDLDLALIFLSALTDDVCWDEIGQQVTLEAWIRKVRHFTKENPDFNAPTVENYQDIFWKCGPSLCVSMFQVEMLELVCGLKRKRKKEKKKCQQDKKKSARAELLDDYGHRLGRPSGETVRELVKFCAEMKDVMKERDFSKLFLLYWKTMGFRAISGQEFVYLLRDSVRESKKREYHQPGTNEWYLWHTPHGFSAFDCFVRRSPEDDEKDKLVLIDVRPRGPRRAANPYDVTVYDNYDQHYPQPQHRFSPNRSRFHGRRPPRRQQHSYDHWYTNSRADHGGNEYEYDYEYEYYDDHGSSNNDTYEYLDADQMTTTSAGTSPEFGLHSSEGDLMSQCMSSPTSSVVNGPASMTPQQPMSASVSFVPVPITYPIGYMIAPALPPCAVPPLPPGINGSVGMPIGYIPSTPSSMHPMPANPGCLPLPPNFGAPANGFGVLPLPSVPMTPTPGWFFSNQTTPQCQRQFD